MIVLLTAFLLLGGLYTGGDASQGPADLERLRRLYLDAVAEETAVDRAQAEVQRLRHTGDIGPVTLLGYEGAIQALRAKHGVWPHRRLLHLQRGLERLDAAVAAEPRNTEVRYLRLMTCYYLPGILGRAGSVREDFSALGALLPASRDEFPPDLYRSMARFVIEEGDLPPGGSDALQHALESVGD